MTLVLFVVMRGRAEEGHGHGTIDFFHICGKRTGISYSTLVVEQARKECIIIHH